MKPTILAVPLAGAFALGAAMSAHAQTPPATHAHPPAHAASAPRLDVASDAQAAVSVVERFGQSLAAGDMQTVEEFLSEDVLILESGGAESSREEYLSHHAVSDAKFLKGTHSQLTRRTARIGGDLVWVGSESELHASKDGKPVTLLSTETMVLKDTPAGWRIVHIHWSSRPKKST